jgi:putative membrane protein
VSSFFRLYGYRITRAGSSVTISSGLFSTRSDSFMLSKVNFVKVREPLICRLIGRAILEVEVVGTANSKGVPLLCPLKPKGVACGLLHDLLPEFECTGRLAGQPRVSLVGIGLVAALVMAAASAVFYSVSLEVPGEQHVLLWAVWAAVCAVCAVWGSMAYSTRRFAFDENIALLVTGSCDRTSNYILMDKIQSADVTSTPVQRRAGAARCSLSLLSTAGASTVKSGVFPAEDLEAVSGIVMARIRDGRYDFRRFQRCDARISASEPERIASPNLVSIRSSFHDALELYGHVCLSEGYPV